MAENASRGCILDAAPRGRSSPAPDSEAETREHWIDTRWCRQFFAASSGAEELRRTADCVRVRPAIRGQLMPLREANCSQLVLSSLAQVGLTCPDALFARSGSRCRMARMKCSECDLVNFTERSARMRRGFNDRSGSILHRAQYPSDVIALAVFWRISYTDMPI